MTLSDAAHGGNDREYGQTGGLSGVLIVGPDATKIYQLMNWTSHKQKRISHSSFGAEIMVCADNHDYGFDIKETLTVLFPKRVFKSKLMVDSRALYDTITMLHVIREYHLRKTVGRVRNSFEAQKLDILRWVRGPTNLADALTQRNYCMWREHNRSLIDGHVMMDMRDSKAHDSEFWR